MEELKFLTLTILFELPVALALLWREPRWRLVLVVVSMNLISHPLAWQLLFTYHLNWFAVEFGVALFEGAILAFTLPQKRGQAFFTGLTMNIVTAAIGYIFF